VGIAMEKLLSIDELSEILGVTKATIYSWTYRNKIPHIKLSKRLLKFRRNDIEAWITKRAVSADTPFLVQEDKKHKRSRTFSNLNDDFIEKVIRNAKDGVLRL
jgi:excisionase family DNA binding protein